MAVACFCGSTVPNLHREQVPEFELWSWRTARIFGGRDDVQDSAMSTDIMSAFLDVVSGGVGIIAADLTLVSANKEFFELIERAPAVGRTVDGLLEFREPQAHDAVQAAIAKAMSSADWVCLRLLSGEEHISLAIRRIRPVQGVNFQQGALFAVLFCEAKPLWNMDALLRQHFGLTRAEASVMAALVSGISVTEAAARLGITHTTARNQVSAAMAKMDVSRQAEAVALALSLVPHFAVGR